MANRVQKKKYRATGISLSDTKPKIVVVFAPDAVAKFNWLNPTIFYPILLLLSLYSVCVLLLLSLCFWNNMTIFPYEKLLLHLRVASLIGNYGHKHGTHKSKSLHWQWGNPVVKILTLKHTNHMVLWFGPEERWLLVKKKATINFFQEKVCCQQSLIFFEVTEVACSARAAKFDGSKRKGGL